MKNKRKRMIYIIATLALSMSFFLIGVYSTVTRTVSVSGTITFTASNVLVSYNISKSEAYAANNYDDYSYRTIGTETGESGGTGQFNTENQTPKTAGLGDLQLHQHKRFIAVKITFTRLANFTRDFYIKVGLPSDGDYHFLNAITINNDGFTSPSGLKREYGVNPNSTDIIVLFESVEANSYTEETKKLDFDISVDLQLTPFS